MNTVSIDLPREGWEWNAEIGAWVSTGGSYGGGSGNPVLIQEIAPTGASEGDLWYCSKSGSEGLYCFDGAYWFETSSNSGGGDGESYDDTQITADLATETQARIDGDAALQGQIDSLENYDDTQITADLATETQARVDGDAALQGQIDSLENYDDTQIKADLATETQARIDGDAALQGQIDGLDLGGAIDEAPSDGKQYARQDTSWSEIVLPESDAPSLLYGSWSYNSSSATSGAFTTRNANWVMATTLTLHKNDTSGYEHSFELMTEGDVIVVQAPSGGAEYRVISKTVTGDVCDFVVDTISAFGTFPSNGNSVDFNFVPQIASGAGMVISAAEPVDPIEGMQWLNSNTAEVFIFDGAVWLEFPAGSSGSGGGLWEQNGDDIYYNDGNIGVGTDSPSYKTEISTDGTTYLGITSGDTSLSGIMLGSETNKSRSRIVHDNDDRSLQLWSNSAERVRIDREGKVGIGTDDPSTKLNVVGDATNYGILAAQPSGYAGLSIKSTNVDQTWSFLANDNGANSDLLLYGGSSAGTKVVVDHEGNVGIGTEPSSQLHISKRDLTEYDGSSTDGQLSSGATVLIQQTAGSNNAQAQLVFQPRTGYAYNRIVSSGGSAPFMAFCTNNSEAMRIEADGTVKVGELVASDPGHTAGIRFQAASGSAYFGCWGNYPSVMYSKNNQLTPSFYDDVNNSIFNVTSSTLKVDGRTVTRNVDLIETLSTLRKATQDETTLEGLRDSIGDAIGGLIEKFEAMQNEVSTMPAEDSE